MTATPRLTILAFLLAALAAAPAHPAAATLPEGFERIASLDTLELSANLDDGRLIVRNLDDGVVWKSFVAEEDVRSELKPIAKWLQTMSSLVVLEYTNFKATSFVPSAAESVKAVYRNDGGRLVAVLDFTDQEISLEVEVWLEDRALQVSIPFDGIREYGTYGVMKIDVLPFLLSGQRGDSGYLVYPDGCGALHRFSAENQPYASTHFTLSMYEQALDVLVPRHFEDTDDQITSDTFDRIRDRIMDDASLPVFGIAKNGSAVLGVIAEGDANGTICVDPSGYAVDVDRIYPSLVYRREYKDPRAEVAKKISYYEQEPTRFDTRIAYLFLAGGKADYSGMADAYRSMLLAEGTLEARAGRFDGALSVFCGIVQKRIIFNKFIAASTFDQAASMVEQLGLGNAVVNLKGSGARGFAALDRRYRPAARLGGLAGFARLQTAAAQRGNRIFLEENFVDITSYIRRPFGLGDVFIRDANKRPVMDAKQEVFFVSPRYALDLFTRRYVPGLRQAAPAGITFARIGEQVFRDLNPRRTTGLADCVAAWREMLRTAKRATGGGAAQGGNYYAIGEADWLYDVPMDDSGCALNDETVPFYQMVVHGLVDYSAGPGNLTHDVTEARLKWAEYGCVPYFELTYTGAEQMMETSYNRLYSSAFEEWQPTAKAVYQEYRDGLAPLATSFMVHHERIDGSVVKVTYDNGAAVYVNYGNADWAKGGVLVRARDYTIARRQGGGNGP